MSGHTPGPWVFIDATKEAKYRFAPTCIIKSDSKQIASFSWNDNSTYFPTMVESQANARLIAAAPELYQALRELLSIAECEGIVGDNTTLPLCRAALLKASPSQSSEGK